MRNISLRYRLLLSYVVLLLIVFGGTASALVLFLNTRPAPVEPIYGELMAFARTIQARYLAPIRPGFGGRRTEASEQEALEELALYASEFDIRILVADPNDQTIQFDSNEAYDTGDTIELRELPRGQGGDVRELRGPANLLDVQIAVGSFIDENDGSEWLYMGVRSERRNPRTLLLTKQRPTQSLGQSLSVFADSLGPILLQSTVVGLALAFVLAAIISRGLARGLQALANGAEAVAAGDYNRQVDVDGPPEIRRTATAFNTMGEQVQASQQALRDMLANVSHDLKTPLTSIQGHSQAIVDGAAPNPAESAAVIYEEAGRLNRMVVQLTDLARLQAGALSMRQDKVDLGAIVESIAQRLSVVAEKKNIDLQVSITPTTPVIGDGDRLAQIVMNLASNALKYTPRGGKVWMSSGMNHQGVEFIVRDTGVGLTEADQIRIFERFYQVEKARGPSRGTGLGLAIVQEITEAHGGRISATSAGQGMWSTFTLWLPASGTAQPNAPDSTATPH